MKAKRILAMLLVTTAMISMLAACGETSSSPSPQGSSPVASGEPAATPYTGGLSYGRQEAAKAADGSVECTSADEFELRLGHVIAEDSPYHQGSEYLAQLIEQRTNGRVKVTVYPAAQLGGEVDLFEGMTMGTVDMALTASAPLLNFCPEVGIIDIPYLFDNYEHAYAVLDGDIGTTILSSLENAGVVGLSFYEGDFMTLHMTSSVTKVEDMKGKKIRTMENPLHIDFVNMCGGVATPMAFSETYTALDNNTVDGGIQNMCQVYATKFYIPSPYQAMTRHVYNASPMMITKSVWDKMPADYQAIIKECALEAASWQRAYNRVYTDAKMKIMASEGAFFEEVDQTGFKAVADEVVARYVPSTYSQELFDSIRNCAY